MRSQSSLARSLAWAYQYASIRWRSSSTRSGRCLMFCTAIVYYSGLDPQALPLQARLPAAVPTCHRSPQRLLRESTGRHPGVHTGAGKGGAGGRGEEDDEGRL